MTGPVMLMFRGLSPTDGRKHPRNTTGLTRQDYKINFLQETVNKMLMAQANLYPPQYRQNTEAAVESVTVTLLNHERPTVWNEVSHWIDAYGAITNSDLCQIADVDTLAASRMLRAWVDQGVLEPLPNRAKRNMAYTKPAQPVEQQSLLSGE